MGCSGSTSTDTMHTVRVIAESGKCFNLNVKSCSTVASLKGQIEILIAIKSENIKLVVRGDNDLEIEMENQKPLFNYYQSSQHNLTIYMLQENCITRIQSNGTKQNKENYSQSTVTNDPKNNKNKRSISHVNSINCYQISEEQDINKPLILHKNESICLGGQNDDNFQNQNKILDAIQKLEEGEKLTDSIIQHLQEQQNEAIQITS